MAKKVTHGGRRDKAGRPLGHGEPTKSISVRVPLSLLKQIDRSAQNLKSTRNQIIVEALQASHGK